jgi:ABC-2 type transport system permease protein
MKLISCFIKTFKENLRDWKILILAIVFAPFFVYLMHLYFSNAAISDFNLEEFDLYIPSMLVLAIIMMLFTAGASIVREIEKDTITRLSLSKLTSPEFMTALSLNQIIIGLICLVLTLLAAFSVGYKTSGSIPLFLLVGTVTCFSVISISIITACFIRTMFGLLTLGCFPFFILAFFSDCFFPLPKINLLKIAGNQIYLTDFLPTATATRAFNKILNFNSGFSDIAFEVIWITALALVYFFIGTALFKRKYKY